MVSIPTISNGWLTTFHDAVTDELTKSGRYQVVTSPEPDVLESNVAITNVEPTGKGKNAAVAGATAAASAATVPGIGLADSQAQCGEGEYRGRNARFNLRREVGSVCHW